MRPDPQARPARLLVTGATGFVGRAVATGLAADGHALTFALRRPDRANRLPVPGRAVVVGEIGPDTDWREALAGVDAVLHLAAHVHVAPERAEAEAEAFERINHFGTAALRRASAAAGIGLFVHLGSIMALGAESPPGRPLTESAPPAPIGPYARSKLAAERALQEAAPASPGRVVILRPPLIAGQGVGANLGALARLATLPLPLPFGALRNRRTLLSLPNLVGMIGRIVAQASREPGLEIYNLGDASPVSTAEMIAHLRAGLGRRPGLVPVPPMLLRLGLAALGRQAIARRLIGDLEIDSSAFRRAYGWSDLVQTGETLARIASASGFGRT